MISCSYDLPVQWCHVLCTPCASAQVPGQLIHDAVETQHKLASWQANSFPFQFGAMCCVQNDLVWHVLIVVHPDSRLAVTDFPVRQALDVQPMMPVVRMQETRLTYQFPQHEVFSSVDTMERVALAAVLCKCDIVHSNDTEFAGNHIYQCHFSYNYESNTLCPSVASI